MTQLSVIIVNYNVKYFLEQALLSVRRASRNLPVEVFVVDNNSVDDSVPMVREKFPEVRLIVNAGNPGFAVANNQAIRQAAGKYILLLNPDTVVEEDTFERCLDFLEAHPEAGGLGVKMIDGSGAFLPESKRGFPSPWVAFCKAFGLSRLFPRSRLFNRYHLGYLDENGIHEVEVLAGAFMMLRREALEKVGLLDEKFFMYGEDIDLSYRLIRGGYKNYYFPKTQIIHYKGESTKKGSLNYVRTFYQAMILFARKHFRGQQARAFVFVLQLAIYFRAFFTLLSNAFRRLALPLADAVLIYLGLLFLKDFWATYHFRDPDYYHDSFLYINAPLYTMLWVASIFFSGGYDVPENLRRLLRGLFFGTLLLAAVYGFLDLEYRSSRAIIVLGALWAAAATLFVRMSWHFLTYGNLSLGRARSKNLVIVGSLEESKRVRSLLHQAQVWRNFIGTVFPEPAPPEENYLSNLSQLEEVVHIYKVDEIIFCSSDVSAQAIMRWMRRLGPGLEYKIVPEDSLSIIGSRSKNTAGELYTIDIQFNINQRLQRRNKRLLDVGMALFLLVTFPLQILLTGRPLTLVKHIVRVCLGRMSWVGYGQVSEKPVNLPDIRPGVLSPADALELAPLDESTLRRLDLFYAKDYNIWRDLDIIWKGWRRLGRPLAREKPGATARPKRAAEAKNPEGS